MMVEITACTPNPVEVISLAAGTCYGKRDCPWERVRSCYIADHMSVFEHASVTFRIEGISRACSHQLVRHRLASFCQESQRYCKVDTSKKGWYVMPAAFEGEDEEWFEEAMWDCACNYRDAIEAGIRPEDARYLLPEAAKTAITVTMNCRELFHFLNLRQHKSAQWEIRELANQMEGLLLRVAGWREIMALREKEAC